MAKVVDERSSTDTPSTSKTPNRDARKLSDPKRPGKFKNVGGTLHQRLIPAERDDKGKITKEEQTPVVQPGQTFEATGDEAEALRADGGSKFQEITEETKK